MRTLRTNLGIRAILFMMVAAMGWLGVGPAFGENHQVVLRERQRAAWERTHRPKLILPDILTQASGVPSFKKITPKAAVHVQPIADVRLLSPAEMRHAAGRGPFRNPYFAGSPMPWQRSFHDVNMCDGNLFKSFTDIQVAPGRGAGLVLQRTYNSNEATVGPFGVGWTHAYDIHIQEAADVEAQSGDPTADTSPNDVPRTDFFGHKHTYHRDADGLYSPPPYLFDQLSSDYDAQLVGGPTKIVDDTDVGMDGTVKHYTNVVTLANGTEGNDRACDYIQDRYGNKTVLTYGLSYTQADGSTRKVLTQVMDPTGRSLVFTWTNLGTAAQPAYRITQAQGPLVNGQPVSGATNTVTYGYYTSTSDPNAANDLFNLKSVTLDTGGLNRATTYTYTGFTGTYYDQNDNQQTATENGLLASVTDPMGHVTSYTYNTVSEDIGIAVNPLGTIIVTEEDEAGSNAVNAFRFDSYADNISDWAESSGGIAIVTSIGPGVAFEVRNGLESDEDGDGPHAHPIVKVESDSTLRARTLTMDYAAGSNYKPPTIYLYYDANNNVTLKKDLRTDIREVCTYGSFGNLLTDVPYGHPAATTCTYDNASQYFAKATTTDANSHTTQMGVGTDTAGNAGDPDPNIGDRGQTLWVQDPGYADSTSPSYHKQYTYAYNQYGQKISETNLNGVTTTYTYGASNDLTHGFYDLGNLVQVVQDPGTGHLNRTTTMHYDAAGRVIQSTDCNNLTSVFAYNTLGQPTSVQTPATAAAPADTLSYTYRADGKTSIVQDSLRGATSVTYEDDHYNDYVHYNGQVYSVSDPQTGAVSYTYLPTGERASMTLPGGRVWTYAYAMAAAYQYGGAIVAPRYIIKDDNLDSATHIFAGISDNVGRVVNFALDDSGVPLAVQSNQIVNSSGSVVAFQQTSYQYDRTAFTNSNGQSPSTENRILEAVTGWYWQDANSNWHQRLLYQNNYSYDNGGRRVSNQITTPALNADGSPQYTGGSPQYGAGQFYPDWAAGDAGEEGNYTSFGFFNITPVSNQVTATRTELYAYDDLDRVTAVDYGDGEKQGNPSSPTASPGYTFDAMGNRLSRTDSAAGTTNYSYNAANMLTASTGTGASTYTPDADGNTLSGGGRSCAWDSQNRMVSCTLGGQASTFTYGADGLRRSMTAGGVTTYYVYDGQNMVEEMQGTPSSLHATATYLTGPTGPLCRVDETRQTEGYYPPGVQSSAPLSRGVTRWYACDGLGSVVGEADFNGDLTCADEYDVYGAVRGRTGAASTAHGFVGGLGHLSDASTGLIYMRARYYDPSTGRFQSEDPKGSGNNWFAYCGNDPVNEVDASGEDPSVFDKWANTHSGLNGLLDAFIGYLISVIVPKLAVAAGEGALQAMVAKQIVGNSIYDLGTALITGGEKTLGEAGVELTVSTISKNASVFGDITSLTSAIGGVTSGISGASALAAGIALQYIGSFIEYS